MRQAERNFRRTSTMIALLEKYYDPTDMKYDFIDLYFRIDGIAKRWWKLWEIERSHPLTETEVRSKKMIQTIIKQLKENCPRLVTSDTGASIGIRADEHNVYWF